MYIYRGGTRERIKKENENDDFKNNAHLLQKDSRYSCSPFEAVGTAAALSRKNETQNGRLECKSDSRMIITGLFSNG